MGNDDLMLKFGYTEMYEWVQRPDYTSIFGKFVQFDEHEPDKIRLCKDKKRIVGVTTTNAVETSDNPNEWRGKNLFNEYGDVYLQREKLAVGEKQYDQLNEMAFIHTRPWEHLIPITNPDFNAELRYARRSDREEWIRVNLIGKVIVEDDGTCEPGKYCTPYVGKMKQKQGTAIPADEKEKIKFYVIKRISNKTIMILYR